MSTNNNNLRLEIHYSIVEYLKTLDNSETGSDNSSLTGVISQLQDIFLVDANDADNFKTLSYSPVGLQDIFSAGVKALNLKHYEDALSDAQQNPKFGAFVAAVEKKGYFAGTEEGSVEYYQRYSKLINKFKDKAAVSTSTASTELPATVPAPASEAADSSIAERERQAEELKSQGNAAINAKNYLEAAVFYSKALKLSSDGPNSHVYYSNRAAAYCHLNKYQESINDCQASLRLVPGTFFRLNFVALCFVYVWVYVRLRFIDSVLYFVPVCRLCEGILSPGPVALLHGAVRGSGGGLSKSRGA